MVQAIFTSTFGAADAGFDASTSLRSTLRGNGAMAAPFVVYELCGFVVRNFGLQFFNLGF